MEQPTKSLSVALNVQRHNKSKIRTSGGEVADSLPTPERKPLPSSIAKQIMAMRAVPKDDETEEPEEDFFSDDHLDDPMDFSELDDPVEEESKISQIMKRLSNR